MLEIYIKLLPVFACFFLGLLLKTLKLVRVEHGALLLKVMFFFTLPILVLVKLTETQLSPDKAYLPLMNVGINLAGLAVMFLLTRKMEIPRPTLGVMLLCSMVINNFFTFPFIVTVLGDEAFVDAIFFDIGNAITTMTLGYALAFHYGPGDSKVRDIVLNVIKLPALWALVLAIFLNLNSVHLPATGLVILEPVGLLTMPFILVSLGIYFSPKINNPGLLLMTISARMLLGLVLGLSFVFLFNLKGVTAMVVILCGSAPIGFNGLTFSSMAKLDMTFASSVISVSILIGLFSLPILLYLLQSWIKI